MYEAYIGPLRSPIHVIYATVAASRASALLFLYKTMSVLSYSEVVPKKIILHEGEPFEVLSSHVFRMQMRKPVNQTKLRSIKTGRVVERSFHQAETVEEADVEYTDITFLYHNRGEYWFCEKDNPKNRFKLEDA